MSVSISGAGSISGLDQGFNITSGNLGIGTDNPSHELDIESVSPTIELKDSDNDYKFQLTQSGSATYIDFDTDGGGSSSLRIRNAYDEKIRIQSDGKVGINTNNPKQKLSVVGRVNIDNQGDYYGAWIDGDSNGSSSFNVGVWHNAGGRMRNEGSHLVLETQNTSHNVQLQPSGGNVGINETNPQNSLHISGSSPAIRFADTGANGSAFSIIEDNNGLLKIRNDAGNSGTGSGIVFEVDAAERLHITSGGVKQIKNGNLNIYQTYIDFSGDQSSTPQTAVALYRPADGTFAISTQNTERLRITSAGDIGIGIDSPAYSLDLGESSSTIRLVSENNGTAIRIGAGGGGNDVSLIRVDGNSINNGHHGESDNSAYGFSLKYMGSRGGNNNSLSIFPDNQTGTQFEAVTIQQDGSFGINEVSPDTTLHISRSASQNDTHGILKVESTSTGTGAATNASLITKNRYGWSQFMQWEDHGLRIGSRSTTTGGEGKVTVTYGADSTGAVINENGVVTMPQQCGFHMVMHTNQAPNNNEMIIQWDTDASDSRSYIKNCTFNGGRFVAPVAGLYYFTAQLLLMNVASNDDNIHLAWTKGSGNDTFAYWNTRHDGASANGSYGYSGYLPVIGSTTVYLAANEIFGMRINYTGDIDVYGTDKNWGHWSGFLVG